MATIREIQVPIGKEPIDFVMEIRRNGGTYTNIYLVEGTCVNCQTKDGHLGYCPANRKTEITNFVYTCCPWCKLVRVKEKGELCYGCLDRIDGCSCMTPDWCTDTATHTAEYYATKRAEWKTKLAAEGIRLD